MLEGRDTGSSVGSFDDTGDYVVGPCVGILVGGIMNDS